VENTERALRTTLELAHPTQRIFRHHGQSMTVAGAPADSKLWIPPINKTVATEGKGIAELAESIAKHAEHLRQSGDWAARDRARLASEMETLLQETLMTQFFESISQETYEEIIQNVLNRNQSPFEAVQSLLNGSASRQE
jgi:LAO/AO transport system kinase